MDINLSQYAGFCDGVKRAYDMVMAIDTRRAKKPIFVLGSLVHNGDVIAKIAEKGITRIERADFFAAHSGDIGTIIVNAHGAGPDFYEKAKALGVDVVDTTCPKVIKVQRLARVFARRGLKIVIIGDHGHKEVRGINEWGDGNAVIISEEEDLGKLNFPPEERIAVLSQTTQNEDFYKKISDQIKEKYKNAEIQFTACQTTHDRQGEIKKLAKENDVIVVIGSRGSANSNRLFEIAKNINTKAYFIENSKEIKKEWFSGVQKVAVTAGASTPGWIIKEVVEALQKI
jgi:4-hydroxy-3-methylbut-2-enyl diphosphate reductase